MMRHPRVFARAASTRGFPPIIIKKAQGLKPCAFLLKLIEFLYNIFNLKKYTEILCKKK